MAWAVFAAAAGEAWPAGPAAFARALWHGGLHLDRRPVDPERPPERIPAGTRAEAWGFAREPECPELPDAPLWEGFGLIAVDKPAWLATQRTRASARLALEAMLRERLGEPGLAAVHRLDRPTSGVVLLARERAAAAWMEREWREGRVTKRYLAWVAPPPARAEATVRGRMRRVLDPARIRFALAPEDGGSGRPSETRFVRRAWAGGRALLEAWPRTGRTHQIRVHAAAAGHPVVGDDLYGPPWAPGLASSAGRVLLHAVGLRFRPPGSREPVEVEAPLPPDFPAPG